MPTEARRCAEGGAPGPGAAQRLAGPPAAAPLRPPSPGAGAAACCCCCWRSPASPAPLAAAWLGHDPNAVDLLDRFAPPAPEHPLGTDELGRDLLLRLLYGGRVSLFVGLVGALAAAGIGTLIGLVAGYVGGRTDALLMRLTDAVIALPLLPLLIVLAAVDLDQARPAARGSRSRRRRASTASS